MLNYWRTKKNACGRGNRKWHENKVSFAQWRNKIKTEIFQFNKAEMRNSKPAQPDHCFHPLCQTLDSKLLGAQAFLLAHVSLSSAKRSRNPHNACIFQKFLFGSFDLDLSIPRKGFLFVHFMRPMWRNRLKQLATFVSESKIMRCMRKVGEIIV